MVPLRRLARLQCRDLAELPPAEETDELAEAQCVVDVRRRTWKMLPPQPLTVSLVVVASPMATISVRMSAAKNSEAVDKLGTPSRTVPSASNRPRRNAAYTAGLLVSRIADGTLGVQPLPLWSAPGRPFANPAACHQRASRTD